MKDWQTWFVIYMDGNAEIIRVNEFFDLFGKLNGEVRSVTCLDVEEFE